VKHWLAPEIAFPAEVSAARQYFVPGPLAMKGAAVNGAFPSRLDEALRHAVARVEDDPQKVAAIVRHLRWDGHTAEQSAQLSGPPQGCQQIVDRTVERLRSDGMVAEVIERSIALAERSVPLLDAELCQALLKANLCYVRFSCHALASTAAVFRKQSPFEIASLSGSFGLLKSGTTEGIHRLAERAQTLVRSRGCANMVELTEDARVIFGPNASQRFTEAAVRTLDRFEWLDQQTGWFWYIPDRAHNANRLVDQIQQSLAATERIPLAQLRSGIRRQNGLGGFSPPLSVLASVCKRLLFLRIEGDTIVRAPGLVPWDSVLAPNEKCFLDVLQSHGPVLSHKEFLEFCRRGGMSEVIFGQAISTSAILQEPNPGTYALVGTILPGARTGDNEAGSSSQDGGVSTHHGFLSEGQVYLAWKLQLHALQHGVLRVPEPMNTFLEGDFELNTAAGHRLGLLHFRQRACWDVRQLLRDTGADSQDTLVIVLGLRDKRAIGLIGDEGIVAQVVSGKVGLSYKA
jgi:hypothetical protein